MLEVFKEVMSGNWIPMARRHDNSSDSFSCACECSAIIGFDEDHCFFGAYYF